MEAPHVPDLFVRRWRLDQNRVTFTVENLGTGLAQNVVVEIRVHPPDESGPYTGRSRIGQSATFASVVRANDDRTEMAGTVRTFDYDDTESVQTAAMLERIDDHEQVAVTVRLLYEYVRQRETDEFVSE